MAAVPLDKGKRKRLWILLVYFEYLFEGTLVKWDTTPISLEVKHGSKPFNARYYPVPNIKKETLHNKIHGIVEIGVLTYVH